MKNKIWFLIILLSCGVYIVNNTVFWQSVTDITAKFCNSWVLTENLNITTDSAKLNEICTQFTNSSDKDISINIGFPDWAITNDSFKKKACRTESNRDNFWKYVIQKNKTITIPAQKTIIEKNHIKFPAGFEWITHGCLTYFINNTNSDSNNWVNVIVRQTSYIDILVGSKFKREIKLEKFAKTNNLWSNKKINTEFNFDSTISIKLNFINSWDVDETFIGSWKIYDKFWFSKDFEIQETKLTSNSKTEISVNIWSLPFYWWMFKIELNWTIVPDIVFNKDSLAPKLKENITIKENTTITIIPRNIVIWIIIFLIIFFTIRKLKKRTNNL